MQIDAKLKHYKGFYQLSFYKLKTIKTHLRGRTNGPRPFILKKGGNCNYVNTKRIGGEKKPFLTLTYSFIIN